MTPNLNEGEPADVIPLTRAGDTGLVSGGTAPSADNPVGYGAADAGGRIVIVGQIYRSAPGEPPTAAVIRFARTPGGPGGQAYVRRVTVKCGTWTPLDTGWVDSPGMIIIENYGPGELTVGVVPLDGDELAVVSVLAIPAGEQQFLSPARETPFRLHTSADTRIGITVLPG